MSSLREYILGQKANSKTVSIPGWDRPIRIQEMTVGRKIAFFQHLHANIKAVNDHKLDPTKPAVKELDETILGFIFSVVDEDGELVFSVEDADKMDAIPYKVIQAVYYEAVQLGNLSSELKEIEAEKKD